MPYRILLTTHHITSQSKLSILREAARQHNVSCLLKIGAHPPGIMLCEGNTEDEVKAWHAVVKRLRYKDCRFVGGQDVLRRLVNDGQTGMQEVDSKRAFGETLGEEGKNWWRVMMGWK